jgi:hypothetical protein
VINNRIVVSLYRATDPPTNSNDKRKIEGGPLYAIETLANLATDGKVIPWSNGALDDFQKWSLDNQQLGELICEALKRGRYVDSEWCTDKPGGNWAACDAYVVDVKQWVEHAHKDMYFSYYLKIALSKTGQVLLSASNHPEGT